MWWIRTVLAVLLALPTVGSCRKKKKPPPRELASLKPDQACKHFFRRVKTCAASINRIKADKLKLKGPRRATFLRQLAEQVSQAFSNLDLLCERYALKTRKQQTDMDRCYRERTCEAFGQCFVQMADAELSGPGGKRARTLEEIRKQIRELKDSRLRRPGGAPHGHMHAPKPRPMPKTKPKPMLETKPRP
jgi:hypothetical protein